MNRNCVVCVHHTFSDTHTHTRDYYSNIKRNKSSVICNNMDGLGGYYSKRNKTEKEKYGVISLICRI